MDGKIHFLNTGHSDCIIIESKERLAIVDAAEDNDYPADKPHLNMPGYEEQVTQYILNNFSDCNGKVTIDFVLGTHAHSDHLGGFDAIINHPDITVKRAYLKPYKPEDVFIMERLRWDNFEVYSQMLDAIHHNNVELITNFDNTTTTLGDFRITFFNGSYKKRKIKFGENINSVVTLAELGNNRVVLAGDFNYKNNDEKKLAPIIGKVNLLKVAHHGYVGSTSVKWAKTLSPEYSIVCNNSKAIYPDVRFKLTKIVKSQLIATADVNGVIAQIDDNGIRIETDIM